MDRTPVHVATFFGKIGTQPFGPCHRLISARLVPSRAHPRSLGWLQSTKAIGFSTTGLFGSAVFSNLPSQRACYAALHSCSIKAPLRQAKTMDGFTYIEGSLLPFVFFPSSSSNQQSNPHYYHHHHSAHRHSDSHCH